MKKMLFLLSHQPNPRFVKQIKYLSNHNEVDVVYYFRDYMKDLSSEYGSVCGINKSIGSILNGNYLQRIGKYLQSVQKLYKILKVNKYDTLIVNNIDTLALFKICTLFQKIDTKIVIEISDLRSHAYTKSLKSKVMRVIEQFMFKFVDKLIVTSPKFYEMYYNKVFNSNYFVLENKPLSNMIPSKIEKIKNKKTVIGIVGLLLQGRPYETLFETIKNDARFEVHIYGKGTYQKLVEEYASKYENIKYFGEYNFFQDSAKIYASLDILYMPYDTTNGSLNNKIALPNKLYEAIYFQVPIITSSGTYLGELVEEYGIGETIKCCDEKELLDILNNIDSKKIIDSFNKLDSSKYLADDDYKKLEEFISE
ncbi:glycosyltransferase [Aliarcobacter butzleri]